MFKIVVLTKADLYPSERDTPITDVTLKDVAYDSKTDEAIRHADIVAIFSNGVFNMLYNRHGDLFWGPVTLFASYLPY